jgi:hypothetical protein
LYGFETWSLTLREEQKLRVSQNRAMGRMFGHKEGGSDERLEKTAQ